MCADPKSTKKDSHVVSIFCTLMIRVCKAARRTLMKFHQQMGGIFHLKYLAKFIVTISGRMLVKLNGQICCRANKFLLGKKRIWWNRCQFHIHFTSSFLTRRIQKPKKTLMTWLSFLHFGDLLSLKLWVNILVKLTWHLLSGSSLSKVLNKEDLLQSFHSKALLLVLILSHFLSTLQSVKIRKKCLQIN